jgi:hypothetical protein
MAHKGGHHKPKTQAIRKERRERAEAVTNSSGYKKLSVQQKLERLLASIAVPGFGEAKKQRARLEALLRKEHETEPVVVSVETPIENGEAEKPYNKKGKKHRK